MLQALAQHFLLTLKRGGDYQPFIEELRQLQASDLARLLPSDADRLAFWINVYNAFTQVLLAEHPDFYRQNRMGFFRQKWIQIGQQRLSLNDLEHGLLRRSQFAYGFGYVFNPFAGFFEVTNRVARREARVHFALNCGAMACPPILFYGAEKLDSQLEMATASFLQSDCRYDPARETVEVSQIFRWFSGDFGGPSGVRRLLVRHGVVPPGVRPRLVFRPYDWSLLPGKFAPAARPAAG